MHSGQTCIQDRHAFRTGTLNFKTRTVKNENVSPLCGAQPFFAILFQEEKEEQKEKQEEEAEQLEHHGGEPADFTYVSRVIGRASAKGG